MAGMQSHCSHYLPIFTKAVNFHIAIVLHGSNGSGPIAHVKQFPVRIHREHVAHVEPVHSIVVVGSPSGNACYACNILASKGRILTYQRKESLAVTFPFGS